MPCTLLVIDPQNDFMDIPGAALPVAGAAADMARLTRLVRALDDRLGRIVVTLDSHATVGIERTTFWAQADGGAVPPFTPITAAEVRRGDKRPRDPARLPAVLHYLDTLEAQGRYTLMAWPVHCVLGQWGHNIVAGLAQALAAWETARQQPATLVLKGLNPMTEQYSAVRAEVPLPDDPRTTTNAALLQQVAAPADWLLVAGQASSHCVRATLQDCFASLDASGMAERTLLLTDCMSPVAGFEPAAEAFFAEARGRGMRTLGSAEALRLLAAG